MKITYQKPTRNQREREIEKLSENEINFINESSLFLPGSRIEPRTSTKKYTSVTVKLHDLSGVILAGNFVRIRRTFLTKRERERERERKRKR